MHFQTRKSLSTLTNYTENKDELGQLGRTTFDYQWKSKYDKLCITTAGLTLQ
jgi:hypothetical protein